jgi:hypothetical protein
MSQEHAGFQASRMSRGFWIRRTGAHPASPPPWNPILWLPGEEPGYHGDDWRLVVEIQSHAIEVIHSGLFPSLNRGQQWAAKWHCSRRWQADLKKRIGHCHHVLKAWEALLKMERLAFDFELDSHCCLGACINNHGGLPAKTHTHTHTHLSFHLFFEMLCFAISFLDVKTLREGAMCVRKLQLTTKVPLFCDSWF